MKVDGAKAIGCTKPGRLRRNYEQPVKTYGSNRVCSTEDCNTKLSIYNPDSKCQLCEPARESV